MADPLSVSASIVGLTSLGIQVTSNLLQYYNSFRGQHAHVDKTVQNLENIIAALQDLDEELQPRRDESKTDLGQLQRINETVKDCAESIQELQHELEKFKSVPDQQGSKAAIIKIGRKLVYPFRESTLQKLEEEIAEIRHCISFSLNILQLKDQNHVQNKLELIEDLVALISSRQLKDSFDSWLKAPDPTTNHHSACNRRHGSTGLWFIEGSEFKEWLTRENSFVCLAGSPGTGKSVLCSTAIQSVFQYRNGDPRIGICFYYFTFSDEAKQDVSGMVRALLKQLSSQVGDGQSDLQKLHTRYENKLPPLQELLVTFRSVVERFQHVYLLLDALDESPKLTARQELLQKLVEIHNYQLAGLHILVTSRNEPDIQEHLDELATNIQMDNEKINRDIADYIDSILKTSPALRRRPSQHDRIRQSLTSRAKGSFRWVECQLQSLAHCPQSPTYLERFLAALPPTLDETYARILLGIEPVFKKDARRILCMLCFATRPLTVNEVISGMAVNLDENPRVDPECCVVDELDIFRICPNLIELSYSPSRDPDGDVKYKRLRVSHFSVQEYLTSDRILCSQETAFFYLGASESHAELAKLCLAHMEPPECVPKTNFASSKGVQNPSETAFHFYAIHGYFEHFKNSGSASEEVEYLTLKFLNNSVALNTWIQRIGYWYIFGELIEIDCSPINCAAALGSVRVASYLLGVSQHNYNRPGVCTADDLLKHRSEINAIGNEYGTPLSLASYVGHRDMVQFLLDEGADPDIEITHEHSEEPHNALRLASSEGHEDIVQILLDYGAQVNLCGTYGVTAIWDACRSGHKNIVKHLLDHGADPNICMDSFDGDFGGGHTYCDNALSAAVRDDDEALVQLLLGRGASLSYDHSSSDSDLGCASRCGNLSMVKLLLHHGAEVNVQNGGPLKEAATARQEEIIEVLIASGADVSKTEYCYGSLLALAINGPREQKRTACTESLVQKLIDVGADVNLAHPRDEFCRHDTCSMTPLQHASLRGRIDIVSILLNSGAEVNAAQGRPGSALKTAVISGKKDLVELLINHGGDINVSRGDFTTPLCAATLWNRKEIKRILVDHGAQDISEEEVIRLVQAKLLEDYPAFFKKEDFLATSIEDLRKAYASIPIARMLYNISSSRW